MPQSAKKLAVESTKGGDPTSEVEVNLSDKLGTITTKSLNIQTLDDALKASNVDLKVWEVDHYIINSWEVTIGKKNAGGEKPETFTNYQVKVWLRRITPTAMEDAMERVLKRFERVRPHPVIPKVSHRAGRYMLELALHDAHFGLLAWGQETGEDFDLKIVSARYESAILDLLDKTKGFEPEKILLPIGHDFLHVNNPEGYTPASHNHLDVDGRLMKVMETAILAVIRAIEVCLSRAPVEVIWVPGNHDPETSWFLCRILKAYFHENAAVTIDVSAKPRKYRKYGINLIGFTHGNEEKFGDLPTLMASEMKEAWSVCTCYEFHLGHYHKKKEMRFNAMDTYGNVRVRVIPSLCGTDAWHFKKGYVQGYRVAEAFVYDHDEGLVGEFTSRNLRA